MKSENIKCKLLKEKDKINNDLVCRLIFDIRKQTFAVDFTVSKICGEITIGSSGYVDKLDNFGEFKNYAKRNI